MAYTILVVDDSKTVRRMIARAISLSGLAVNQVHDAEDGRQGLAAVREHWVDLVVTDINMPQMNGIELVRALRGDELTRNLPVVVVSTEGSEQRIHELEELGIQGYLRKPFTPEGIKAAVESALEMAHADGS